MAPNSVKIEVWGVAEALGKGLGTILAPKGAPGTKKIEKGHSSFPPQGPSWSPKFILFQYFECFFHLFLEWRLGRLPGRYFMALGCFFGGVWDDFLEIVGCSPNSWKCRFDTVFTMF